MSDTFTCARCGGVFDNGWSEEKVVAEFRATFMKDYRPEECDFVCDACYNVMHPDKFPARVEQAVADTLRARITYEP